MKQDLYKNVQILMSNRDDQTRRIDQYQAKLDRVLDAMERERGISKPRTKAIVSSSRSDFQNKFDAIVSAIESKDSMIDDLLDQMESKFGRRSRNGHCAIIPINRQFNRQ
ncbi:MAG: hypothetical protein IJ552_07600 [Prevotella sp.]|nr:hypothetical protein [Prevotella sp.]